MAHTFKLTDGSTTVQLNSGSIQATRYAVQSAAPQSGVASLAGDLGLSPFEHGDVAEAIELFFSAASVAAVQADAAAVRYLLDAAKFRQDNGHGPRVYFQVQFDGEAEEWRSEILAGRLVFDNAAEEISRLKMQGLLSFTRRYFFETVTERQLEMTTSETTVAATTGVLYNNDDSDSTKTNWINFAAAQIVGSLPAPLRLRITNAEASALAWRDFYVSNQVFSDPSNLDVFLLGGEAVDGANHTWGGNAAEYSHVWNMSDTRLTRLAGRYYRILVAFSALTDGVRLRPVLLATSLNLPVRSKAPQVLTDTGNLHDIGVLQIPPEGYHASGTEIALAIQVQNVGGGTANVDFVQLTPAGDGLYRRWRQIGFSVDTDEGTEDNGPDGTIYHVTGGRRVPIITGFHKPIHVWPGRLNRLRVLMRESDFTAGRKMKAQAWYRPRRMDI